MSDATALNTQADRLAAAKAAQAAREAGIRAQAIKQGRELERAESALERAKLEGQHAGEIQGLKQAHLDELARHDERWKREEAKHGSGKFWSGVSVGSFVTLAVVSVVLCVIFIVVMNASFDAGLRGGMQQSIIESFERPPTTDEPRSESAP